ncbi:hypothetical protein OHB41_04755 [Streptomyces sp. NBC_01571]|uniref:hypothetical protein n=1 Tax=Streptomyces sp. NBC_01571 TaxID=2975883 RepID=UPI00224D46E2|nr:hypothetical protein [Streptomyces sp. NBC_01571]MCX4572508.1 hypothetical protein [Streptomyces sp. NBC_01571]
MRTNRDFRRSGPAMAFAALPLTLVTVTAAAAASGISVSASGSRVTVTTSACRNVDGGFGSASLLSGGQSNFSQGRQVSLSGTSAGQSAVWSNVGAGTYTVIVLCQDGRTAGTQAVKVSAPSAPSASSASSAPSEPSATSTFSASSVSSAPSAPSEPAVSATAAAPTRGVLGGLGGAATDRGTATTMVGGALVTTGVVATAWFLRRRSKPQRL